jgi:hypothetical protein
VGSARRFQSTLSTHKQTEMGVHPVTPIVPESPDSCIGSEPARQVRLAWTAGVRFRYSRLKEAVLFAVDAMGFQSTLVGSCRKEEYLRGSFQIGELIDLTKKPRLTIASS